MFTKLFSDRILIKVLSGKDEKIGSIIIPDRTYEKTTDMAEILYIGDWSDKKPPSYPLNIKEGDVVLIKRGKGMHVTKSEIGLDVSWENEVRLILYDDLIGVLN